jgi:hypothetical protein
MYTNNENPVARHQATPDRIGSNLAARRFATGFFQCSCKMTNLGKKIICCLPRLWENNCFITAKSTYWAQMFKNFCSINTISGANPMIASYNASIVNFYNATGSLSRFKNKNILFYFEKCSSLLQRWRCSFKCKNRRIGSWTLFSSPWSGDHAERQDTVQADQQQVRIRTSAAGEKAPVPENFVRYTYTQRYNVGW